MDGPRPDVLDVPSNRSRRIEWIAAGLTLLTGSGLIAGTLAWQNRPAEANLLGTLGRHLDEFTRRCGTGRDGDGCLHAPKPHGPPDPNSRRADVLLLHGG